VCVCARVCVHVPKKMCVMGRILSFKLLVESDITKDITSYAFKLSPSYYTKPQHHMSMMVPHSLLSNQYSLLCT